MEVSSKFGTSAVGPVRPVGPLGLLQLDTYPQARDDLVVEASKGQIILKASFEVFI